jgi:hypothetical protein
VAVAAAAAWCGEAIWGRGNARRNHVTASYNYGIRWASSGVNGLFFLGRASCCGPWDEILIKGKQSVRWFYSHRAMIDSIYLSILPPHNCIHISRRLLAKRCHFLPCFFTMNTM